MAMEYYNHYSDYPMSKWNWPDFSPREMACRGTGKLGINRYSMDRLQALRTELGRPLIINSAYRSPEHNTAVGGAKKSQHLKAIAFDVSMSNQEPGAFEAAARKAGFTGFGFYTKQNFIHIDTGLKREWGKRWPVSEAGDLPVEMPEVNTNPAKDKGIQAATLVTGAAAVREAGGFLADMHPYVQGGALALAAIFALSALYLGWSKLKEILS